MIHKSRNSIVVTLFIVASLGTMLPQSVEAQEAQGQTQAADHLLINYQGRLTNSEGKPVADGNHKLVFKIYNQKTGGSALWNEWQTLNTQNGIFSTQLGIDNDLASLPFDETYYLGVTVDDGDELSPRTRLTTVPYAQRAHTVDDSSITTQKLAQSGAVTGDVLKWNGDEWQPDAVSSKGETSSGWSLTGNTGTSPDTNFVGTTDQQPLVFKVNNQEAARIEPAATTPNINLGSSINKFYGDISGAIIGGGNPSANQGANVVNSSWTVVGGGYSNSARAEGAVVAGGMLNTTLGKNATIGGGKLNYANGGTSTIGGGSSNSVSNQDATIGGGDSNKASGAHSVIGGGFGNTVKSNNGSVGGGSYNMVTGVAATVPGGEQNSARGEYSFAAGSGARANHAYSFIWYATPNPYSDTLSTTGQHQFIVDASGGMGVGTNQPKTLMHVQGNDASRDAADNPSSSVLLVENKASSGDPSVLGLQAGTSSSLDTTNYISFYDQNGNSVGAIESNGNNGVTYNTTGADFAEMLPAASDQENYRAGDLVGVQGGTISKSTAGAEQLLVVTGQAGLLGNATANQNHGKKVPVTFVGQVPVKVRGPVQSGDLIVASGRNDGTARAVAAKAWNMEKDGPVAGRSWQSVDGAGIHKVNVAVGLDRLGGLAHRVSKQQTKINNLENEVQQLRQQVQKLAGKIKD